MDNSTFDELVIVKRSGQRVSFNGTKIAVAIKKAFDSVYNDYDEDSVNKVYSDVLNNISSNYTDRKTINVEDIQDIIESSLKNNNFMDVYTSFNVYRVKRNQSRELFDRKQQHKFVRATEKLVLKAKDEKSINPVEQLLSFGKTISEEFSKAYLLDSKFVRSHDEGIIYIHDLDYYVLGTTKSAFLDLSNILVNDNYFNKIIEIFLNIKKEQYGEQELTSFDHVLVPYVIYKFKSIFKDRLISYLKLEGYENVINIKSIEQSIDKLDNIYIKLDIFNKFLLNDKLHSIFKMSYDYSLNELNNYIERKIKKLLLVLNENKFSINNNAGYSISIGSNKSKIGLFIINIYLKAINELERLNNVTTIYKISNNIDNNNIVSKIITQNKNIVLSNINTTFNKINLSPNNYKTEVEYFKNGDRIKENINEKNVISTGRMIISETSINLVRIALTSNDIKDFYNNLNNTLDLIKNELIDTFEYNGNKYKENFKYIFKNNVLLDTEKLENGGRIKKVIKNGTLNICCAGLKETLYVLLKKDKLDINDLNLGVKIIEYIKEKCNNYTNEHKLNFCVKETSNPKVLKYFLSLDKAVFGNIKKVTDKETYTLFSKIFGEFDISFKDRFAIESKLEKNFNGGYNLTVNMPHNSSYKKIMEIIDATKANNIGYIKITVGKSYL